MTMCTLSVISLGHAAFQLVFNRDESPLRPPADPPRWQTSASGTRYLAPLDPLGGGTWLAVARSGLCLAIVNSNPEPMPILPPRQSLTSRGLLIPNLISQPSIPHLHASMQETDLDRFAPFRLLAIQPAPAPWPHILEFAWDRSRLSIAPHERGPICLVSSGLGDSRVSPRLDLFNSLVRPNPLPQSQLGFHRHAWFDKPEISVLMHRPDARTVSITSLRIHAARDEPDIQWDYLSLPHDLHSTLVASDSARV